jgi:hypothetical protein
MTDPIATIASTAATTVSVVWAFGWLLVLLRRAGGGFSESPDLVMPWLTSSVGLGLMVIIEVARRAELVRSWTGVAACVGTVLGVVAVFPMPDTGGWAVAASLIPLVIAIAGGIVTPLVEHSGAWRRSRTRRREREEAPATETSRGMPLTPSPTSPPEAGFRQRLERFQTSTDGDRALGRVIVDVPTGSRTGHAHIGFCPPFVAMPTVEVSSDDDAIEAVVTAAEVVPWGVRVECRLSEAAEEPLAIPVDVLAHYP